MPPQGRVNTPQNRRILNGRVHQVNRTTPGGVVYMTCATKFCFGTARRLPNGVIVPGGQPHNLEICHAEHTAQLKADFREELKASMQRNYWEPRQAYDLVVTMFEGDDRGNVRVLVPFNSVLTSLKRWRRWEFPACPTSLSEMADHLQNPDNDRLLEHRGARLLTTRRIVDAQEKLHLLIFNEEFVRNEFNNVSKIFIDGTFQTTPRVRDVYQLVTILGIKHDHALPFAYVLMASKTQVAYTAVLRAVSGIMNVATVKVVMTDYEQARNSCREVFNQAHVAGCSVHYDRALLKKFKSLQLPRETRNRADVRLFVKKMMALAYLPPRMIVAEYTTLKNTLEAALRHRLSRFLTYYTRQWLTRVTPEGFSVFKLSRRTNNVVESYNSVLATQLQKHPRAWTFITKLVKLTKNAIEDLRSLAHNNRISRHPKYVTSHRRSVLRTVWQRLQDQDITPAELLTNVAALKGRVRQTLRAIPNERLQEDEELEHIPDNAPRDVDSDYDQDIIENEPVDDPENENAEPPVPGPNLGVGSDHSDEEGSEAGDHQDLGNGLDTSDGESSEDAGEGNDLDNALGRVEPPGPAINQDNALGQVEPLRPAVNQDNALGRVEPPRPAVNQVIDVDESEDEADDARHVAGAEEADNRVIILHSSDDNANVAGPADKRAAASRKKNQRKKRRLKRRAAEMLENAVRPYGHKRRNKGKDCVICKRHVATECFVPCGHICSCKPCAVAYEGHGSRVCPCCREQYIRCITTYRP